ncbi:NAD(P)/FAD-dependent oxidoreductase [Gordonia sp. TBRC 11910]|uniref:NAD(P)/FAD-dependent oxidoreductase n=1 Tax=Gordonia asplenii TaxID=2725283 RepID=A0A848L104_9ACTN|nr:NAD(P)/FAD-dependent oxidoreductase [Gordonia asplenii]NMO04660.1 NAD(P)/FAD-dependent oxidoreductase [Gordonia asplenii]
MTSVQETAPTAGTVDVDAVVVGAGFSGLFELHRLRQLGMSVKGFEAGSDVGGTWYWNRYPGARSDSDSTVYSFSDLFDADLLPQWRWSERYPSQAEILRYLNWVADRKDLRRDISFGTRVTGAEFDAATHRWTITTDDGETVTARYFIPSVGVLSKPNLPSFPGLDSYGGQWFHTSRMPAEPLDYTGKRVAVIGNGATAVQIIPVVAHTAETVYEFSRNPYHCLPGRNHELDEEDWKTIESNHLEIFDHARQNFGGFPYAEGVEGASLSEQERRDALEAAWRKGGLAIAFSTFADVAVDKSVNDSALAFIREKIAGIVRDPQRADRLTPTSPFVGKRPPIEHGYYAAFNRDNVGLVDMKDNPIERISESGIVLADGTEYPVDIIIFATGFDAFTGALYEMNIRGADGRDLRERWEQGPSTYLGMAVPGFPNMLLHYCGPHNPAILTNGPTLIEQQGTWIGDFLARMNDAGHTYFDATSEAEAGFMDLHNQISDMTLIPGTASWWTGTNVDGKPTGLLSWAGGFPEYRRVCDEAAADYAGFQFA